MHTVPPIPNSPPSRPRLLVDDVSPQERERLDRQNLAVGEALLAETAAAAEREPVLAGQAERGMLLALEIEGENVGVEVRHVEPSQDGEQVLIVLAGAEAHLYHVNAQLNVIDKRDAAAAQDRLRAKRRTARQIAILRELADAAERSNMPLPFFLRIEGSLSSLDEVNSVAAALGSEVTGLESGVSRVEHTFGDVDASGIRYTTPVELVFSHYVRNSQ